MKVVGNHTLDCIISALEARITDTSKDKASEVTNSVYNLLLEVREWRERYSPMYVTAREVSDEGSQDITLKVDDILGLEPKYDDITEEEKKEAFAKFNAAKKKKKRS